MRLYTVVVYDLRMYMKEDYPGPREIISKGRSLVVQNRGILL